ncbi:MAG: carbamoyl-phosphate synthase small subunit [Candidatus Levybacteria bacterium]|nr:carbamoyl-phosphate synthase small subunit [Candidatus Levybacteria bacterium]
MIGKLILEDASEFEGISLGAPRSISGEVVFSTGMVGYPESLTDPSYKGQILIFTYPLIGNYGIPDKKYWESDKIQVSGFIVSNYIDTPYHQEMTLTLRKWAVKENVPFLEITDTRLLTQKIRTKGTMLGKIITKDNINFYDPNKENLVAQVSTKKVIQKGNGKKTVILIDCGAKQNIERSLLKRGVRVITVPWNFDPFDPKVHLRGVPQAQPHLEGGRLKQSESHDSFEVKFDGIVVSNGPGDPKMATKTIETIRKALASKIPVLGICLGHQLLALAGGGDTQKLKFGHRSQNQPCVLEKTKRCYITTQNHGFEVSKIPKGFHKWFTNANDNSNEGIIHQKLPFMSVQFHPEAAPGPEDTGWIFDYFLEKI